MVLSSRPPISILIKAFFVLVNYSNDGEFVPMDLITGIHTSYNDTISALSFFRATKIIVEEFVGTSLPIESKFHVINREVAAIESIDGRGINCPCFAVVDTDRTRLDQYGYFEPGGFEHSEVNTGCAAIEPKTGKRKAGPVKKDLNLCKAIPALSDCLIIEMSEIALILGNRIGVVMCIDMFLKNDTIHVQEYSANHMNGIRHCAAKMHDSCIDVCCFGQLWDAAGDPYRVEWTAVPDQIKDCADPSTQQQCSLLMDLALPTVVRSTCGIEDERTSPNRKERMSLARRKWSGADSIGTSKLPLLWNA